MLFSASYLFCLCILLFFLLFFFNDTATTEIYTLSLHDALPIYLSETRRNARQAEQRLTRLDRDERTLNDRIETLERSEEHTSELQSQFHLVCRLLLEKKKKKKKNTTKKIYKKQQHETLIRL